MTLLNRRFMTTGLVTSSFILPLSVTGRSKFADIALCLSCDVSGSISSEEYALQKNGLIKALTSAMMEEKLKTLSVAMIYHEWSGESKFSDWFLIENIKDATSFASEINAFERSSSSSTEMAKAIQQAILMLNSCPYETGRKVIDVSGDGPDSNGPAFMPKVIGMAQAFDIRINGLPIIDESEPNLVEWYEAYVKTGPGSFVIPANGFSDFERAMSIKIMGDMG